MQQTETTLLSIAGSVARVPTIRDTDRVAIRRSVAGVLCALGLFTISWDRLANVGLGQYNVKLPVILLTLAALLVVPEWWRTILSWVRSGGVLRWLVLVTGALILVYCVRALFVAPVTSGLAQIVALGTGAIAPALAVIALLRSREDVAWGLRWLLAGTVLAGAFGLWQLIAFYTGLPQLIAYTGVGTSGEGGRIASFNYEPAYFAYFLVLSAGCRIALARITGNRVGWWSIGFFGVLLTLVNARSLLFLLPVAVMLLAVAWRAHRALLLRSVIAAVVLGALSIAVPTGLDSMSHQTAAPSTAQTSASSSRPVASASESDGVDPDPSAATTDGAPEVVPPQLPTNVLDPNEQSSNAPRLDLYKAVLKVDLQHPAAGVGAGGLRDALAENGYVAPNQGAQVVANNVWLQAGADGGIPLLLLQIGLVALAGVLWWRRRREPEQPLLVVWLTVVLVGGMLTSYFFDLKLWVVLALALVAATSDRPESARDQPERASA